MLRGEAVFICTKCGKRFVAPDIEWNATVKSQPMPCPYCGTESDVVSAIPVALFKLFHKRK